MKNKRNVNRVIKVGIVDDQLFVATGYALLLNNMKDIRVVYTIDPFALILGIF